MKRCCGDEKNSVLPYKRKNVVQTQAINSTAVLEKFNFNSKNIFCFQYPRLLSWFVVQEFPITVNSSFIQETVAQQKLWIKVAWLKQETSKAVHGLLKRPKLYHTTTFVFLQYVHCVIIFDVWKFQWYKDNEISIIFSGCYIVLLRSIK